MLCFQKISPEKHMYLDTEGLVGEGGISMDCWEKESFTAGKRLAPVSVEGGRRHDMRGWS